MEAIFTIIQNGLIFRILGRCFLERFLASNNYIVSGVSFLVCFLQFYFFTQSDEFAKAIAFA